MPLKHQTQREMQIFTFWCEIFFSNFANFKFIFCLIKYQLILFLELYYFISHPLSIILLGLLWQLRAWGCPSCHYCHHQEEFSGWQPIWLQTEVNEWREPWTVISINHPVSRKLQQSLLKNSSLHQKLVVLKLTV